ncbi:MAG: class I SAM-dependent methyltransferase [Anaerolineae bacterium]|nr:class I SAM-dependent methyltransferase [Anaerolineae bacterium]
MTHSDLASLRGEPSYVWRAGQERRLQMIARFVRLDGAIILDAGCGVGMYTGQFRQRFSSNVVGIEYEFSRALEAAEVTPHVTVAANENLPYVSNYFDAVLSHETLEHVADDRLSAREIVRVLKPGGRAVIFVPNRWYFFETHGHYWRGVYHFGNTPFINYLPDPLRNRLAPHVRAYTRRGLLALFRDQPVRVVAHQRIYGGFDNLVHRLGAAGQLLRRFWQGIEGTPLDAFGLSHVLVIEKTTEPSAP